MSNIEAFYNRKLRTEQKLADEANEELPFKNALAETLRPAIEEYFDSVLFSYGESLLLSELSIPDITAQNFSLQESFREFYLSAPNFVPGDFISRLSEITDVDTAARVEFLAELFYEQMAVDIANVQSGYVISTTEKDMESSLSTAIESDDTGQNDIIAALAMDDFESSVDGRIDTILETEAQIAGETSKYAESLAVASALSGDSAVLAALGGVAVGAALGLIVLKEWNATLDFSTGSPDSRVREGHAEAHLQVRSDGDAFDVANAQGEMEQLMYPKDGSLGASPSNIINCRCSARYFLGTRDDISG